MKKLGIWIIPAGVLIALCAASVEGAILRLSTHSSEPDGYFTCPEHLTAKLDFSVVDSKLTLSITNLTADSPGGIELNINKIFFNVTDNITGLGLIAATGPEGQVTNEWDLVFSKDAFIVGGFGRFDVSVAGGHGNHPNVIKPGKTVSFDCHITGTGPFSDRDFVTLSAPLGEHILSYAAGKFYGEGDISSYGAVNSTPEPATVCLFACGGLVLLLRRR
ncbi:MAG TPA: hypothetical protein VMW16_02540 [Sedimentisphaerales bacterium]|nr:hypothetical protein [Sedimentisphaerales bacterium]